MSEDSTFPSDGVKSETDGTTAVSTEERKKEKNFFDSFKINLPTSKNTLLNSSMSSNK
jgi:hypothetical protein